MKTWTAILFYVASTLPLIGQVACEANRLALQAERHYRQGSDLPKALELYKKAFRENSTDASKCLDALNAATALHDTSSVLQFLGDCISLGIDPSSIKKLWPHAGNGMDYGYLIARIDTTAIMDHYHSLLDTFLITQLARMAENDQKYRQDEDTVHSLQKKLDSLNWMDLKSIVRHIGRLPYYREIGLEGQEDLEILFYHMDKDIIAWFLPYIVQCAMEDNALLGPIILYQLDRIGMSEGVIYTITHNLRIETLSQRTKMKNGYYCQSFGEWFDERSHMDNKTYETPIDPVIDPNEVHRIRKMFCLDSMEEKRQRRPWVHVVSIGEFESLIHD